MLTSRMRKSLKLILRAEAYITLSEIASKLNVSTRTLLREMDDLQNWVQVHQGVLIKKKGRGITIDGSFSEKKRLLKLLESEKGNLIFTPFERSILLKSEILKAEEITKIYTLTTFLEVSETTVGLDLAIVADWFARYDLEIIKRQGLGISIQGSERNRRKAMVALLYDHIHMDEFLAYMDVGEVDPISPVTNLGRIKQSLYGLFALSYIPKVTHIINNVENYMGHSYTDNGYMVLALVFGVTINRENHWGVPLIAEGNRDEIINSKTFQVLKRCVEEETDSIFLHMCDEEIMYLAMHFQGTKLRETKNQYSISMVDDFILIQLTKEFIRRIENQLNIYISDNETLLYGLVRHLRSAIYRMKMNLDIVNPLLEDIVSTYTDLYNAVAKCVDIIELREGVVVPPDEIAYLAIYIGAIVQSEDSNSKVHYQVVVACMYGIGASQLLLANIKKNFRDIDIVDVVSVVDVKQLNMEFSYADLIISTIPLPGNKTPCVVVNPLLPQKDAIAIRSFLKTTKPKRRKWRKRAKPYLSHRLSMLNVYSYIIMTLLESYSYEEEVEALDINDVITCASALIGEDEKEAELLMKAFESREEIGSTILSKKGMMLLHCRAAITEKAVMKIMKTSKPIIMDNGHECHTIKTFVVMVAPMKSNQGILDVLSEITRSIITGDLGHQILYSDHHTVRLGLENTLENYYKRLVNGG